MGLSKISGISDLDDSSSQDSRINVGDLKSYFLSSNLKKKT